MEKRVDRFEQMFQSGDFDFIYRSSSGASVILYAAWTGSLGRVKTLVEHGASVNAKDGGGSVLFHARLGGMPEIEQFLIEHGAKEGVEQ